MKTHFKIFAFVAFVFCISNMYSQNTYDIKIVEDNHLHVDASLHLSSTEIHMSNTIPEGLEDGAAGLVRNLKIRDADGHDIDVVETQSHQGHFTWTLERAVDKVILSYDIKMIHDQYTWPFGVEEISYRTKEGYMIVGRFLFIVPNFGQADLYTVQFDLPDNWNVSSPWQSNGGMVYKGLSGTEMRDNVLFIGTHQEEVVVIDNTRLQLVLGPTLATDKTRILDYLEPNMKAIGSLFGSAPRSSYLVVMQEGPIAGGAFNQSYSMMVEKPINKASAALWGHGMIHETFHLWNGRGLIPAEQMEWFKEGLTEYLSIQIQARTRSLPASLIEKKLETAYRRYFLSTVLGPPVSLQEAGNNKNQNRFKIYGMGTFFALILDIEIRHASRNEKGLEDVLSLMYRELALEGKQYTLKDVVRYTNMVADCDLKYLFDDYVTGTKTLEPNGHLAKGGLIINTFYDEAFISIKEGSDTLGLVIGKQILGK